MLSVEAVTMAMILANAKLANLSTRYAKRGSHIPSDTSSAGAPAWIGM
jgi:hypothetical protein